MNDDEYLAARERAYRTMGVGVLAIAGGMLIAAVALAAMAVWLWSLPLP